MLRAARALRRPAARPTRPARCSRRDFDDFLAGKRDFDVLFEPTERTSLAGYTWTRNHLVLNVLDDVKNQLSACSTPGTNGGWTRSEFPARRRFGTLGVGAVDADDSDAFWLTATDYLTPTTLSLARDRQAAGSAEAKPAFFDASEARDRAALRDVARTARKVPYFLVRPKDLKLDGSDPTLLYGYGGFEVSLTPAYSGGVGKGWLEKGGVYVRRQHPRRRRVRPALAPGGAARRTATRPTRTSPRSPRTWSRARSRRPSTSASRAAATAAC